MLHELSFGAAAAEEELPEARRLRLDHLYSLYRFIFLINCLNLQSPLARFLVIPRSVRHNYIFLRSSCSVTHLFFVSSIKEIIGIKFIYLIYQDN